MEKKRPIDIKRDSAGPVDIGTKEDGAIVEMFELAGRLIIIKEKSVYELRYADDIDPKRENPDLPSNVQRLLLKLGSESELLSRTFLTSKRLFRKESLLDTIDINSALLLSLEASIELVTMDNEINEYTLIENQVSGEYEALRHSQISYAIPSITDVNTRCKTIFQKADHSMQALMDINKLFFPDFKKTLYYTHFTEFINKKYGETDLFYIFLNDITPFAEMVRNIRNCLDHRRPEIDIKDFEIQVDGSIFTPTIEINYLKTKLDRISLVTFLPIVLQNLITIFENMIVFLCNKNLANTPFAGQVVPLPLEKRKNKHIQYGYWLSIGPGGFYQQ